MNLLNTTVLQAIAFVLFLVALPLLSFGTMEDQQILWWVGLAMIVVAGLLPPVSRFLVSEDEDGDEDADADDKPADDADKPADADDRLADDSAAPTAGPIGEPASGPGREPQRARVEEQQQLAHDGDGPAGGDGEKEDKS